MICQKLLEKKVTNERHALYRKATTKLDCHILINRGQKISVIFSVAGRTLYLRSTLITHPQITHTVDSSCWLLCFNFQLFISAWVNCVICQKLLEKNEWHALYRKATTIKLYCHILINRGQKISVILWDDHSRMVGVIGREIMLTKRLR